MLKSYAERVLGIFSLNHLAQTQSLLLHIDELGMIDFKLELGRLFIRLWSCYRQQVERRVPGPAKLYCLTVASSLFRVVALVDSQNLLVIIFGLAQLQILKEHLVCGAEQLRRLSANRHLPSELYLPLLLNLVA